jgi:hypothetical protein
MSVGTHAIGVARAGTTLLPGGHVPCLSPRSRSRPGIAGLGALCLTASCATFPGLARGPARYRPPSVVLAYPARGAALPADKAVLVFRFAAGETDDPVDVASFKATVDGVDRTALFRVTDAQAWAALGDTPATPGVTAGPHVVGARICSARGACGALTVSVDVRPWERALAPNGLASGRPSVLPNDTPTVSANAAAGNGRRVDDTGA